MRSNFQQIVSYCLVLYNDNTCLIFQHKDITKIESLDIQEGGWQKREGGVFEGGWHPSADQLNNYIFLNEWFYLNFRT